MFIDGVASDNGPHGFNGGLNAKQYSVIADTLKAMATGDLQDLVQ